MPVWLPILVLGLYLACSFVPIYWLIGMSLKNNQDILGSFQLLPVHATFDNYLTILTDPDWNQGYINSITYVLINTVISLCVALPAAYAFSRYRFLGDNICSSGC
jgi:glycerol transport system permease protein